MPRRTVQQRPRLLTQQTCHTQLPTKPPFPSPQSFFSLITNNSHTRANTMAYIAILTITLLASVFTFSRAYDYPNKTISNTTLSTRYGAYHTIRASQPVGNKNKDSDEMACLTPMTTVTTTMVTLLSSTTDFSTAHPTPCANITITGLHIGPLIVCTPPSTVTYTPETNTSSLLHSNTTSHRTSTPLHDPKSTATVAPSAPPAPTTVFITVTQTVNPSSVPFMESSAYVHVSQPGKQPFHSSESATPSTTLADTPPTSSEEESSPTGLPHFTLDPEPTSEPGEPETSSAPVEGGGYARA